MLVKKSVLLARLQNSLEKFEKERIAHEKTFARYKVKYLDYLQKLSDVLGAATTYQEWDASERVNQPARPQLAYQNGENIRRVKRNMRLLDLLEDDAVEIEKLQTGRNYSLGDFIDSLGE